MRDEQVPTGLARRRRRLSDAETEQRMLQAAMALVGTTGLTVSLDHISFEDIIRDAGVSRSAVYRHWPYKDLFFSDLLKALARAAAPAHIPAEDAAATLVAEIVEERPDALRTARSRHALCVEILRRGASLDFDSIHGSTEWRSYLALHATFLSLTDDALRDEVREALADSERMFVSRIARSYQRLAELLGYRPRPETNASFEMVAAAVSATMRGHVITALSTPTATNRGIRAAPFGGTEEADWTPPAVSVVGLVLTFLEQDPTIEWDRRRIASVRRSLRGLGAEEVGGGT